MTITEKDYNKLSEMVYWVDPKHEDYKSNLKKDKKIKFNNSEYEILDVKHEPKNGMQAMAVAPIVNGKADTSQVVIAYAGTNSSDDLDIATDIQTVGAGSEKLKSFDWFEAPRAVDAQSVTARQFADSIRNQYPFATITTTGHSLGESLAFYIAAENKWLNVGFNGPYAGSMMSKAGKMADRIGGAYHSLAINDK